MLTPFESSKMLVSRAREHFDQFDEMQCRFITAKPQRIFAEKDRDTAKVMLKVEPPTMDGRLLVIVFDIVNCLRSALDHAVYDSARVLGGSPKPSNTKFPFGKDLREATENLDRHKASEVPLAIRPFLLAFEPYKRGKEHLWELNQLRNQKIHRILQPMAVASHGVVTGGIHIVNSARGTITDPLGRRVAIERDCSVWDDDKGVLTFAVLAPGTRLEHCPEIKPTLAIGFGEGTHFPRFDPAVELLKMYLEIVDRIVLGIERETARLKIESPS